MVDECNPKVFLIENVKGLVTHNKGKTLKRILSEFNDLKKYNIYYKVLNANDFNVPQNRYRLFIIGVNKTITKKFQFPKKQKYKPVLKDVLLNCPTSAGYTYNKKKYELMSLIPEDGCWVDLPEDKQKDYLGKSYYSGRWKEEFSKDSR